MNSADLVKYTAAVSVIIVVTIVTWRLSGSKNSGAATAEVRSAAGPIATPLAHAAISAAQESHPLAPAVQQSAERSLTDEEKDIPISSGTTKATPSSGVVINGRALSQQVLQELQIRAGVAIPAGRYWYDTRSGLWGLEGSEPKGLGQPGFDFGPLSARASNGNTGAFINGREINTLEAAFYVRIYGQGEQGRFWLDSNGNLGREGNPIPVDNLFARIQRIRGGGSQGFARGGMVGISNGDCTYVTTDTGYNASTCD